MIAIDYEQDPKPAQLFQAMQKKLEHLQKEVAKVKTNQSGAWENVSATVRQVGQQETCQRLVIDLQDTMRKLLKEAKNLDDVAASLLQTSVTADFFEKGGQIHIDALAVPTTTVLSSFDPRSFPSCFVEFYYGDAVPGLSGRPNSTVTYQSLFSALMQREEMEYSCSDDVEPYQARAVSRFDSPEFAALFGDILRKMKTLQAVNASFQRQGFEKDLKTIASSQTTDFLAAAAGEMCGNSVGQIIQNAATPPKVRAALRHMLFSTATVPLTEGYKVRLRHFGQSLTHCFGPTTVFCTHNYGDTYNPLMRQLCENLGPEFLKDTPEMPPLQKMHELTAAHPACTAKFFLLMEELNFRHIYGVDSIGLGIYKLARAVGQSSIEDDFASSSVPGVAGFALAILEALEAQGRGFQHGHRLVRAIPGFLASMQIQDGDLSPKSLRAKMLQHNAKLISQVNTLQYEKSTLVGEQAGIKMKPEPFSALQQKQTKFDGGLEADEITQRLLLPVVAAERLKHVEREIAASEQQQRPPANFFKEVSLTGAELSTLPEYKLPCIIPQAAAWKGPLSFSVDCDESGVITKVACPDGEDACNFDTFLAEAHRWEQRFAEDFRFLHIATHNHECSVTCLKHVKKTAQEKRQLLKPSRAPDCRFSFYHTVKISGRTFRRRGKMPVSETNILDSVDPNESGLVQVQRAHPFRSATSDVTMVSCRCNCDFKFLIRGFVVDEDDNKITLVCDDSCLGHVMGMSRASMHKHDSRELRLFARNVIALHVASFNTDHYITKYSTKPMEAMQSAVAQFAVGIRRLEEEESKAEVWTPQYRAKRVIVRLAAAANRSTWVSSTELATTILCAGHCWATHAEVVLFLSRPWFLMQQCRRLLENTPSPLLHDNFVPIAAVELNASDSEDGASLAEDSAKEDPEETAVEDEEQQDAEKDRNQHWDKTVLRTTTTLHDDYLHRGPWLAPMPLFVYASRVRRVRKPLKPKDHEIMFEFDPHYQMHALYCQCFALQITVPRIVGPKPPSLDDAEANAAYFSMLFLPMKCQGLTCCTDPLNCRPALTCVKIGKQKFSFVANWKARRAAINLVANRAQQKIASAEKIAVLFDTTVAKSWWNASLPGGADDRHAQLLRATLMQLCRTSFSEFPGYVFQNMCDILGVQSGAHVHQLTLEEFAAIESQQNYQNFLSQQIAQTKPLRSARTKSGPVHEQVSESDGQHSPDQGQNPAFDGEAPPDDEDSFDEELHSQTKVSFTLSDCIQILSREQELERTKKPGKHREGDLHIKQFADIYKHMMVGPPADSSELRHRIPILPTHCLPQNAKSHQAAVAKLLRKEMLQSDATTSCPASENLTPEMAVQQLEELFDRNANRDEAQVTEIDVPLAWKGPAAYAKSLIDKFPFNQEQLDLLALLVNPLEVAWRNREDTSVYTLPVDLGLVRVLLVGGGGCGKTTVIVQVLEPLLNVYFGAHNVQLAAPSNKAARIIGGKTIHNLIGVRANDSLKSYHLCVRRRADRKKLQNTLGRAGAVIIDEWSQVPTTLFHAASLRATSIRADQFQLDLARYAQPTQLFGRVSFMLLSGDHLQLPPVPKTSSLLATPDVGGHEHKAALAMFARIPQVFVLQTAMRFEDEIQKNILRKMRVPGGERLTDQEWSHLSETRLEDKAAFQSPEALVQATGDWYESCYLWSITTLIAFIKARHSAREANQTLFFVPAADWPDQACEPHHLKHLLGVSNLSTTKKLPGVNLLHFGQKVRLTTSVLPPWAVQDTVATIVDIAFAERLPAKLPPEYYLKKRPTAVYVKLEGVDLEFLPPKPCGEHLIFNRHCDQCVSYPGVIQVLSKTQTWSYTLPDEKISLKIKRTAFPLWPEKACSLYTMQGTTASPGLVAHMTLPARSPADIKFLAVYVMLSRPRSFKNLLTLGLNDKIRNIIESGPPEELLETFATLFGSKADETREAAREAAEHLGWQAGG